jgi:hypothetical protein
MEELKQQQLAAQMGLQNQGQELGGAQRMLSDWLTGTNTPHSVDELQKQQRRAAEMYGLNYDELMKPVPQPAAPAAPAGPASQPGTKATTVYSNHPVGGHPTVTQPQPQPTGPATDYGNVTKGIFNQ